MQSANPLRILIAGMRWPPETFLARLIRGLLAEDFHVTVAAHRRPDDSWLADPRLSWLSAPSWESPVPNRLLSLATQFGGAAVRSGRETQRLVQVAQSNGDRRQQLVHLNRWLPYAGRQWDVIYFPWNASAITHEPLLHAAPVVISCRGAQINIAPHKPGSEAYAAQLAATFEQAAAVHCVSEAIAREASQYGLDAARVRIIRPAVDPAMFCPPDQPRPGQPAMLKLVTTGSLIWRKGYETMLAAVRLAVDAGVPAVLEIIGDGPERSRLLYTIDDLDLGDRVTLHGRLTPAAVVARLQDADVFLLSSLSEGISNAVLEGMACGLPAITSDVGGMAEAVSDGVEGLLVPSRDPEAMAAAICLLWEQPALRQTMGGAARRRIVADFQLDDQIAAFANLFREVAA